jgi:metal-responsive CopG/Arc/MetJ family transcriptional regulator
MRETPDILKRTRGRPVSGRSPIVSLALPAPLLVRVDASADHEFESRARAIRRLLEFGLRAEDRERRS